MRTTYSGTDITLLQQFFTEQSRFKGTSLLNRTFVLKRPANGTKITNKCEGTVDVISDNLPFVLEIAPSVYDTLTALELTSCYVMKDGSPITGKNLQAEMTRHKQAIVKYSPALLAKRYRASYVPVGYKFPFLTATVIVNDASISTHGTDYIHGDFIVNEVGTNNYKVVNGCIFYHTFNKQSFSEEYIKQLKKVADSTLQTTYRYAY